MSLRTPDTIKKGIERLMDDLGPLHTASVFAFDEANGKKIEDNLARAKAIPGTRWLDLRDVDDGEARARLVAQGVQGGTLVLVLGPGKPTMAVSLFLRQVADGEDEVDLGKGVHMTKDAKLSLIVVACGVAEHDKAPAELQRINYWFNAWQLD